MPGTRHDVIIYRAQGHYWAACGCDWQGGSHLTAIAASQSFAEHLAAVATPDVHRPGAHREKGRRFKGSV